MRQIRCGFSQAHPRPGCLLIPEGLVSDVRYPLNVCRNRSEMSDELKAGGQVWDNVPAVSRKLRHGNKSPVMRPGKEG